MKRYFSLDLYNMDVDMYRYVVYTCLHGQKDQCIPILCFPFHGC